MYDPLFELNDCNEIDRIYNNIFTNYDKIKNTKYILYIKANKIHYINQSNCKNIFNMFNNRGYLLIDEIS